MSQFNPENHSHRRYNPLTDEWVQVSPHRAKRPWQGQTEKVDNIVRPEYDESCYLCPGNTRKNGEVNPDYKSTYSFVNDFSALELDIPEGTYSDDFFFQAKSERGICKVLCFSPKHNLTVADMTVDGVKCVIDLWQKEYIELGQIDVINYVQIFENKGEVMGCSNPHPHGQIWAQESIPVEPSKKQKNQEAYFAKHGKTLLSDYLAKEKEKGNRIIFSNEYFTCLVPFWAVWPYETMIVSNTAKQSLLDLNEEEKWAFAEVYNHIAIVYDQIFETSFPYSAGIHQAPTDGKEHKAWHFHMVFYPPLLRSATVKKFMVGYEMLANPQRDITAEQSAEKLKEISDKIRA